MKNRTKKLKDKINRNSTEKCLAIACFVFPVLFFIVSFLPRDKNFLYYVLGMLLYFLILVIVAFIIGISQFYKMLKREPFTFSTALLAVVFIGLPVLLYTFSIKNITSDLVNSFYSIAVGVGINYVIDSVFKYVESDVTDSQKKILIKKATTTKIFFNVIYISEYLSFIFVEYSKKIITSQMNIGNEILKYIIEWYVNVDDIWAVVIFTVIIFIIIMFISFYLTGAIKKEVENEAPADLIIVRQKLSNEVGQVNKLLELIREDNLRSELDIIKSRLNSELEQLDRFDVK